MAKKNCRRREEERLIHDKAVGIRKMTDRQIILLFEQQYKNGFEADNSLPTGGTANAEKFNLLEKTEKGISDIKGIGAVTMNKIKMVLEKI